MSLPSRDPDVLIKRVIVAVWAAIVILAARFGFVACLIGMLDDGHPILIGGAIGCLLGLAAGIALARMAIIGEGPRRP